MKKLVLLLAIAAIAVSFTNCHGVRPDADEEAVLIKKPWFFGFEGVVQESVSTGLTWCAFSTSSETFKTIPIQYVEEFDDIITKDNNPVDFNSTIRIRILKGKTPTLYEFFGVDWYENNVAEQFRAMTRTKASDEMMFTLTSDRSVTDSLSKQLKREMIAYVLKIGLPVEIESVIFGKVTPPEAVLIETNRTAAQKQAIKTQVARELAENSRKAAETAKASADKAYKEKFNMTTAEYLQLRTIEVRLEQIDMIRDKDNVTVILNSGGGDALPTVPLR